VHVIKTRDIPGAVADPSAGAGGRVGEHNALKHHMYVDESKTAFFRRPSFTPDGSLFISPAGQVRDKTDAASRPTTWVFHRDSFSASASSSSSASASGAGASTGGGGSGYGAGSGSTTAHSGPKPLAHIPVVRTSASLHAASVLVRCSPVLYTVRATKNRSSGEPVEGLLHTLPHRMMYAIATMESVLVYDTQHAYPLAAIANMHYDKITDLAW
jgi:chromatin assembly factor 1 subunit B